MTAPRPLPWRLVAGFAAGLLVPVAAAAAIDPRLAPAAAGGAALGLFGPAMGGYGRSAAGAVLALAVLALGPGAGWIDPRLGALLLAGLAGLEVWRSGGRSLTWSLFAGVMVVHAGATGPALPAAGVFAGACAAGAVLSALHGLGGRFAPPPAGRLQGLEHACFLAVGLLLSLVLVARIDAPHAIWIAQLFVLRGLAPAELRVPITLRFAAGVAAGAGIAAALEAAGIAAHPGLRVAAALLGVVVGLRGVPVRPAVTAGAFTLAVLLGTGPTPSDALFRAEAALLSAALAILIAIALQALFRQAARLA